MSAPTAPHDPAGAPCSPTETDAFLEEVGAIAAARGERLTPIRRKVLELLIESESPAKAYDLLGKLDGEGAAKPPTVYRALDFLRELGVVHKIESLNAYVACGHLSHRHSAVFLLCERCGRAEELHAPELAALLARETKGVGFELKRAVVEAWGLCQACKDAG